MKKSLAILLLIVCTAYPSSGLCFPTDSLSTMKESISRKLTGKSYTISERLSLHGKSARSRLTPHFSAAGLSYPAEKIALVGLKEEKQLELYAQARDEKWIFIKSYPILAASGGLGPKLREGDFQVPEGFYKIELLNPNSQFHLSLRVNYPNAFDREQAKRDARKNLGGDIMIHGSSVSIGCLAMGDSAIEELFTLAADTGIQNIEVILAPRDLRVKKVSAEVLSEFPQWVSLLYQQITKKLSEFSRTQQ